MSLSKSFKEAGFIKVFQRGGLKPACWSEGQYKILQMREYESPRKVNIAYAGVRKPPESKHCLKIYFFINQGKAIYLSGA